MTVFERFLFPAEIGEADRPAEPGAVDARRTGSPTGAGGRAGAGGGTADRGASVRVDHVTKSFVDERRGASATEIPVLRGISFRLHPGEFVAIVGRSGCGKSTLLRLLAGLDMPTGGQIDVEGNVPLDRSGGGTRVKRKSALPPGVRLMFQDPRLLPWRTVIQNVGIGLDGNWRETAMSALHAVGLDDRAQDWPSVLSGGQRQRVALARALVARPRLLLLDEPLGALDALTRLEMQTLLERVWQTEGFTSVLVTHDVAEAVALADRIFVIDAGRVTHEIAVPHPRPRVRSSADLAALEGALLQRLLGSGSVHGAPSRQGART
jgi:sulfonate transport system ATP-binding protein